MTELSHRLADRGRAVGLVLDDARLSALEEYLELLRRWNATINLTALTLDGFPDTTLDRLISEPFVASRLVRSGPRSLFDLGSGGGSPAIPLKIVRPDLRLTMVESRDRKSAFLRDAIRVLELRQAEVITGRIEDVSAVNIDTVTVRAIIWNQMLAATARRMLAADGRLLLFGSTQPHLDGLEVEIEAPLTNSGDRLFVVKQVLG